VILLIDIGNSRIKWATLTKGKLHRGEDAARPEDQQAMAACAGELWGRIKKPQAVVVSNVAGTAAAETLAAWSLEQWQAQPHVIVAEQSACGVTNAYTVAERLGPDRWAALIAARRRCDGPACIIDAGTAVTIDVLAADGAHQGGRIIPGLAMMRRALRERTQNIRPATTSPAAGDITLLARDTQDGVAGGTLYTLVAVIDRVVADIGCELGTDPTRIITGGDAAALLPLLSGNYHHYPDLVLEGLAVIAEKL